MQIRAESTGDRDAVHAVTAAAFGQEDEARLVDALRAENAVAVSLVADEDGAISGHVLLSRLKAPENCLALAPVSVSPGRQGEGIGSALIREALRRAAAGGFAAVFVLGEPGYYTRFGFSLTAAAPFDTEYPKDYFMALEVTPGALTGLAGPVVYPDAFGAAEG